MTPRTPEENEAPGPRKTGRTIAIVAILAALALGGWGVAKMASDRAEAAKEAALIAEAQVHAQQRDIELARSGVSEALDSDHARDIELYRPHIDGSKELAAYDDIVEDVQGHLDEHQDYSAKGVQVLRADVERIEEAAADVVARGEEYAKEVLKEHKKDTQALYQELEAEGTDTEILEYLDEVFWGSQPPTTKGTGHYRYTAQAFVDDLVFYEESFKKARADHEQWVKEQGEDEGEK